MVQENRYGRVSIFPDKRFGMARNFCRHWQMRFLTLIFFTLFFHSNSYSQTVISLQNFSFEDHAVVSKPPAGWYFCGSINNTPPDIQPNGFFGPTPLPFHGHTYVAMVSRADSSFEALGQRLHTPLEAGQCYRWELMLARSPSYLSFSKENRDELTNFNTALHLRIWGGRQVCEKMELLAISPLIQDTNWQKTTLEINPIKTHHFLLIEAFFPDNYPCNGNLLVDAVSPILPVHCNDKTLISEIPILQITTDQNIDEAQSEILQNWSSLHILQPQKNTHSVFETTSGIIINEAPGLFQLGQLIIKHPELSIKIGVPVDKRRTLLNIQQSFLGIMWQFGLRPTNITFQRVRNSNKAAHWDGVSKDGCFIRMTP